jgi:EAL domain-containing protein (putative c-di-GMP-specific phosphodiesterase class I)
VSPLLGLIALPYFVAMASDLKASGYKRMDVFRIYGFNLILVVVNLAGVGASIVQAITADKSTFGRTPKVRNRTIPSLMFVVAPYLVLGLAVYTVVNDVNGHRYVNLGYAALNTVLVAYAIVAFIGLRHSLVDAVVQTKARLYKPVKPAKAVQLAPVQVLASETVADWSSVLQLGHSSMRRRPVAARHTPERSGSSLVLPSSGPVGSLERGGGLIVPQPIGSAGFDLGVAFRTVFQPIVSFSTEAVLGFEALSRFEDGVGPDRWLQQAAARGSGLELELALAQAAVRAARQLPDNAWLALNATEDFLADVARLSALAEEAAQPIVLEVAAGAEIRNTLARLLADPPRGLSVSVSHAEPSYDSLKMVDELRPSFVKLDRRWVEGIATDRARAALVRSFVDLAAETRCVVIAEGIETADDLEALRDLGVDCGQGYLIGRPRDVTDSWNRTDESAWSQ